MNKPIIGIIATSNYLKTTDSFQDTYRYGNNYIKKICDNGAIPYLIPYYNDQVIKETLEFCDGLLLPGGSFVLPAVFDIIDYFYTKDKPILGICLGMQEIGMYSKREKRVISKINSSIDHWPYDVIRDNEQILSHSINIIKDSILGKIITNEKVMVNSFHNYTISDVGENFIISAKSDDGIIEAIEAKNKKFVVGVQFHPEILPEFNDIFINFINSCK